MGNKILAKSVLFSCKPLLSYKKYVLRLTLQRPVHFLISPSSTLVPWGTRFSFIRNDKKASGTWSFLIFTPFLVPKNSWQFLNLLCPQVQVSYKKVSYKEKKLSSKSSKSSKSFLIFCLSQYQFLKHAFLFSFIRNRFIWNWY